MVRHDQTHHSPASTYYDKTRIYVVPSCQTRGSSSASGIVSLRHVEVATVWLLCSRCVIHMLISCSVGNRNQAAVAPLDSIHEFH